MKTPRKVLLVGCGLVPLMFGCFGGGSNTSRTKNPGLPVFEPTCQSDPPPSNTLWLEGWDRVKKGETRIKVYGSKLEDSLFGLAADITYPEKIVRFKGFDLGPLFDPSHATVVVLKDRNTPGLLHLYAFYYGDGNGGNLSSQKNGLLGYIRFKSKKTGSGPVEVTDVRGIVRSDASSPVMDSPFNLVGCGGTFHVPAKGGNTRL